MEKEIKIKTFFSDWKIADKETAKAWVLGQLKGMTALSERKAIDYLNAKLDGTTVEELLEEEK